VPGLGPSKIHLLHTTLGVDSLDALEAWRPTAASPA
jgi:hypothetical protein